MYEKNKKIIERLNICSLEDWLLNSQHNKQQNIRLQKLDDITYRITYPFESEILQFIFKRVDRNQIETEIEIVKTDRKSNFDLVEKEVLVDDLNSISDSVLRFLTSTDDLGIDYYAKSVYEFFGLYIIMPIMQFVFLTNKEDDYRLISINEKYVRLNYRVWRIKYDKALSILKQQINMVQYDLNCLYDHEKDTLFRKNKQQKMSEKQELYRWFEYAINKYQEFLKKNEGAYEEFIKLYTYTSSDNKTIAFENTDKLFHWTPLPMFLKKYDQKADYLKGIYIIVNKDRNKYFVNKSRNIIDTVCNCDFVHQECENSAFKNDYKKSKNAFFITIISCETDDEMNYLYNLYLDKYEALKSGYNKQF